MSAPRCVLLLPTVALVAGCMVRNSKEELRDALLRYNAGVRWGHAEWMAPHVAPANRDSLLKTRAEFGDLQITKCEVRSVVMQGAEEAEATVHVSWYLARQGRLRSSVLVQQWARSGGTWRIESQRLARGAPYPLLESAPPRAALNDH